MNPEEITALIHVWCPAQFRHEDLTVQAIRGLMNANACVLDQARAMTKKQPIRPLSSYPIKEAQSL